MRASIHTIATGVRARGVLAALLLTLLTSTAAASAIHQEEAEVALEHLRLSVRKTVESWLTERGGGSSTTLAYTIRAREGCRLAGTSYLQQAGEKHFLAPEATRATDWVETAQVTVRFGADRDKTVVDLVTLVYTARCGDAAPAQVEEAVTLAFGEPHAPR